MVEKQLIDKVESIRSTLNEISVYNLDVKTSLELYYELARKVNEVITELTRFEGVVSEEVVKQNEKLLYLLGEGLKEQVGIKIDELITNGTIQDLINNKIFSDLNTKLETFKQQTDEQFNTIVSQTNGKNVKFIAFAIRNNGGGFQLINDNLHSPLNVTSVENGLFDVTINYETTGVKVLSLIVANDETMAQEGINVGASVGIDKAIIKFSKQDDVFGYLTKTGGDLNNWSITENLSYGVEGAVWEVSAKRLKITHKKCFNPMPNVFTRNPSIIAYPRAINNRGGFTTTYISFRDITTGQDVAPPDDTVLCLSYSGKYLIPTNDLTFENSNFWCIGMVEV